MMASALAPQPLLNSADIAQIEIYILRWMREFTAGDHASISTGTGFNLVGLKDWEPGDAVSAIDWAQSSLTNFSPLITRQFEQDSNATIIALADASNSVRCGVPGAQIHTAISRCIAALGLAAAFFQDRFGLIAFDDELRATAGGPPRIGKAHVLHCLHAYQQECRGVGTEFATSGLLATIAGFARRTAMLVVVSDFLFAAPERVIDDLTRLHATHDVLLMMIDSRFAFALPQTSAGWIEVFDVESGETRSLSRKEFAQLVTRVEQWQDEVARLARERGIDVVRVGLDRWEMEYTLLRLVAERRIRKVRL